MKDGDGGVWQTPVNGEAFVVTAVGKCSHHKVASVHTMGISKSQMQHIIYGFPSTMI
jgi:hypothetical protein